MHKRILGLALALGLVPAVAFAQAVIGKRTTNLSGNTSATPSAYTTVQAPNDYRFGCTIQDTSANAEQVRVGGAAGVVYNLPAGQTFNCQIGGVVVTDQIEITSATASSSYSAGFQ